MHDSPEIRHQSRSQGAAPTEEEEENSREFWGGFGLSAGLAAGRTLTVVGLDLKVALPGQVVDMRRRWSKV